MPKVLDRLLTKYSIFCTLVCKYTKTVILLQSETFTSSIVDNSLQNNAHTLLVKVHSFIPQGVTVSEECALFSIYKTFRNRMSAIHNQNPCVAVIELPMDAKDVAARIKRVHDLCLYSLDPSLSLDAQQRLDLWLLNELAKMLAEGALTCPK